MENFKTAKINENNGVQFLTFNNISKIDFINHAFSTRIGGISKDEFASMNLSFGRGDPGENVTKNYKAFCNAAAFNYNNLVASSQDHNSFVRKVTSKDFGVGIYKPKDILSVDALITNEPNVVLVTYYADCVPLLFVDVKNKVIGAAHAGWRGTVAEIGKKTVEKMMQEFGSKPKDIICTIGPAIEKCCYEVSEIVLNAFSELSYLDLNNIFESKSNGKYMMNLKEANRQILLSAGLDNANILVTDICTCCNSNLLWSHRATGGKRGTLVSFISIK